MKTTSPKNEDNITQKGMQPNPKNEDNLSQNFTTIYPKKEDDLTQKFKMTSQKKTFATTRVLHIPAVPVFFSCGETLYLTLCVCTCLSSIFLLVEAVLSWN